MVTKNKSKRVLLCVVLLAIAILAAPAFTFSEGPSAEEGVVKLLTPIEGFVEEKDTRDLGTYINAFVKLAIAIATGLAVVMIVIGGITYMVAESISKKGAGRSMINDAIFGLVLALASFIILQTINQDLVQLDFINTLQKAAQTAYDQAPTSTASQVSQEREQEVRSRIEGAGITIQNKCSAGQNRGCTNVGGLNDSSVESLINLKDECGCDLVVTGGTEEGHSTHYQGNKVDLKTTPSLNSYLVPDTSRLGCGSVAIDSGRRQFVWEPAGCHNSTGLHWHTTL